jgi:DNA-binding HxlR family transcriptional regulator
MDHPIEAILSFRERVGPKNDADRIYRHFCMTARALEVIGERWSLLIVRDLLLGPQRFTDLARTLNPITPTRLTDRLRRLEAAGVIEREPAETGKEVWYRLTDAGLDLEPAIDELTLWGIEHAKEPPRPDEPVHSDAAMIGTKVWLNRYSASPPDGLVWAWRFPDEEHYSLRAKDGKWELNRGNPDEATVTVDTTQGDWARFITSPRGSRRLPNRRVKLEGSRPEVKRLVKAFGAKAAPR